MKLSAGASVQQASMRENGVVSTFAANKQVKLKIKLGKLAADADEAKRKALYNGLGLGLDDESDDDASLDDDDDNYSRSNVESPEPSPMSMIEVCLSCSLHSNYMSSGLEQGIMHDLWKNLMDSSPWPGTDDDSTLPGRRLTLTIVG